jgi:hypothetical protein
MHSRSVLQWPADNDTPLTSEKVAGLVHVLTLQ